jgi:hypothetical protein
LKKALGIRGRLHCSLKLFQNFSFGTATLDLIEKAGFRPIFLRACYKTMRFSA